MKDYLRITEERQKWTRKVKQLKKKIERLKAELFWTKVNEESIRRMHFEALNNQVKEAINHSACVIVNRAIKRIKTK